MKGPTPFGKLAATVESGQLEASLKGAWKDKIEAISDDWPTEPIPLEEYGLQLFGRTPTLDKEGVQARIDRYTTNWRLGIRTSLTRTTAIPGGGDGSTECGLDSILRKRDDTRSCSHEFSLRTEYGYGSFTHFPNGDKELKETVGHHSFAGDVEYMYVYVAAPDTEDRTERGVQMAPQIRLRYARNWKASDKVGVVRPGTPPVPDVVEDIIISPSKVEPEMSFRVAMPFTFGTELGWGPAVLYTAIGDQGYYTPGAKIQRVQFEVYTYWFPSGAKGGGRLGVAPFVNVRVAGQDEQQRVEYGAILDLRLGTNLFEY